MCQEGGRTGIADEEGKLPGEHDAAASIGSPPQISKVTWRSFGKDAKVTDLSNYLLPTTKVTPRGDKMPSVSMHA